MGKFSWEGTTKGGQSMKGDMEAPNQESVEAQLRRQGISPGKIKERGKGLDIELKMFAPKVTTKDIVIFTRQFATMIDAGLPLVQFLDILSKQEIGSAVRCPETLQPVSGVPGDDHAQAGEQRGQTPAPRAAVQKHGVGQQVCGRCDRGFLGEQGGCQCDRCQPRAGQPGVSTPAIVGHQGEDAEERPQQRASVGQPAHRTGVGVVDGEQQGGQHRRRDGQPRAHQTPVEHRRDRYECTEPEQTVQVHQHRAVGPEAEVDGVRPRGDGPPEMELARRVAPPWIQPVLDRRLRAVGIAVQESVGVSQSFTLEAPGMAAENRRPNDIIVGLQAVEQAGCGEQQPQHDERRRVPGRQDPCGQPPTVIGAKELHRVSTQSWRSRQQGSRAAAAREN